MHRVAFYQGLEQHGDGVAIDSGGGETVSYARLAELADAFAAQLPPGRQLVALEARNAVESIVAYIACLRHRHPIILLNAEAISDGRILAEYEPNWLYRNRDGSWHLKRLTDRSDTVFAEELAVLLSTSGTTGAPKLVKLSYENIATNADAIGEYLRLVVDDCAITTLEFCYSYGMSVLNAYLAVGARILLTDESVVSDRFWRQFQSGGATSLALVPFHFDLLDRVNFGDMDLPTLRYITQAGGKLHADKVKMYAGIAREKGWSFYVMYGQTEASPRISYVPPDELLENVDSIGKAIPGGELVLVDQDGTEITGSGLVGELVYRGPNVMLGYAECRADLAKPRNTFALRTGDMAQRQQNGYLKIVGRLNRFVKLYGLRINLDEIEGLLRHNGYRVYCAGNDQTLALFHTGGVDEAALKTVVHDRYKIQKSHILTKKIAEVPLLPSGKVNYRALSDLVAPPKPKKSAALNIRGMFEEALGGRDLDDTASFAEIGGDSLSYLTISMRLEEALGYLPDDWERLSIQELDRLKPARSAFMSVPIDTIVRVVAIFSVLTNHLLYAGSDGGAIALIMLVGYSLAKYDSDRLASSRLGSFLWLKLSRILGLYYLIITSNFILTWGKHSVTETLSWYLLVPNFREIQNALFPYWFIGAYAQLILMMALVWQIPVVRRVFSKRKASFGYIALLISFAVAFAAEFLVRADMWDHNTFIILHVFILGWFAFFAKSVAQKAIVSVLAVFAAAMFWSSSKMPISTWYFDFFLVTSCLAVTWLGRVSVPRPVGALLIWVASISFYIYIVHVVPLLFFQRVLPAVLHDVTVGWPEKLVVGIGLSVVLATLAARFMVLFEERVWRHWANGLSPAGAARQIGLLDDDDLAR